MLAAMHRSGASAGAQNGQASSDRPQGGEADDHQPAGGVHIQRIATLGNRKRASA